MPLWSSGSAASAARPADTAPAPCSSAAALGSATAVVPLSSSPIAERRGWERGWQHPLCRRCRQVCASAGGSCGAPRCQADPAPCPQAPARQASALWLEARSRQAWAPVPSPTGAKSWLGSPAAVPVPLPARGWGRQYRQPRCPDFHSLFLPEV